MRININNRYFDENTQQWVQRARTVPAWVVIPAVAAGLVVVVLPIMAIGLAAALVFGVVFAVLGVVAWLLGGISRLFSGGAGSARRNVVVVRRDRWEP